MKKKFIFFYIILILFSLNIDSSQIKSNNKKNNRKSKGLKKKKKPTKRQKRRINQYLQQHANSIKNPISVDNPVEKKKNEIKILLAKILNATPKNTNDRERITQAITAENFSIKGISLDANGNILDTATQAIILRKDEIEAIDINKEITKEGIKEIAEKTKKNIIDKSEGNLKENNGNIVDKDSNIIISVDKINEAIEKNTENKDVKALADVFQPAITFLEGKGVSSAVIEKMKSETDTIPEQVKNNLEEIKNPFSEINLDDSEKNSKINNDFIFEFDFNDENILHIIINAINYFKPFNDGIIDIFGIIYTFNTKDFTKVSDDNILFDNICVLKEFALKDNQIYTEIKTHIEKYWTVIKESQEKKESLINNDASLALTDVFEKNSKSNGTNSIQNAAIEDIINNINTQIEKFPFDKKLKTILLYMYGLIVYCETGLTNQKASTKKDFFTIFINQLLEKTKIREEGNIIFADQIFNKLTRSNISVSYQNIKTYLTNKSLLQSSQNDLCFLMQNSEFNLLLLFNIINTLKPTEKNFNGIELKKHLSGIINEQNNYEKNIEKEEKNILQIKDQLIKEINGKYTEKNIKAIANYLNNYDNNFQNMINNKKVKIHIPYFKTFDTKNSKQEYLNFDILHRYINIDLSIKAISKKPITIIKQDYINIYDIDFKTDPIKYTNQLFKKLLTPVESIYLAEKEGEEVKTLFKYSSAEAIDYLNKIEAYKNYNNENDNIVELINIIINSINLDYYFNKNLSDIKNTKIDQQSLENITKIHEYFINTNKIFLEYLNSIYNVITLKRNYIKNLDKTASQKALSDLLKTAIAPAIISAAGATTYLIGPENLSAGVGHVIDAGAASGRFLGDVIYNNPKTALIFGSLAAAGLVTWNWFNKREQQHKDGNIGKSAIIIPEESNSNTIQLD